MISSRYAIAVVGGVGYASYNGDQPHSVLDDYNKFRNRRDIGIDLAIISGSTAVAIGLTAAWLYYFDTPSAEGVKVVPFTGPDSGGAAISGRF